MSDSSSSHSIPGVATPSRSMTVISMLLMPPVHTLLQVLASSVRPAEAATAHGSRRAGPTPLGRRAPGHDICRSGLFPGGQPSDVVVELEFVGVGAEAEGVDLRGALEIDPGGDQILGEHVTFGEVLNRKSTRLNSSHVATSY